MAAYRSPSSEAPSQAPDIPSLAEIARARGMTLAGPVVALRERFDQIATAIGAALMRDFSLWKEVLYGAALSCALATVSGGARLLMGPGVPVLVVSFAAGTAYGIVRIATQTFVFIDKRTGQDVTVVMPMVLGFGLGLVAFGVEALLSLLPVPSVVSAPLFAVVLFAIWWKRYYSRAQMLDFEHVPFVGVTRSLLAMADPTTIAQIAWNDPAAIPGDALAYRANVVRPDAIRVTCAMYTYPKGDALQVVAEFPASYRWRHAAERVVIDGLTLEVSTTPSSVVVVQATNTHAAATPKLFLHAISVTTHACGPM